MIKLHGVEVKVGDRVFDIQHGEGEIHDMRGELIVVQFDRPLSRTWGYYKCDGTYDTSHHDPDSNFVRLFWNEISPEAIEAAKQKPKEPEYSYMYYSLATDRAERFTAAGMEKSLTKSDWIRIEESKRLVSHE